jgi:hypothetical protein
MSVLSGDCARLLPEGLTFNANALPTATLTLPSSVQSRGRDPDERGREDADAATADSAHKHD